MKTHTLTHTGFQDEAQGTVWLDVSLTGQRWLTACRRSAEGRRLSPSLLCLDRRALMSRGLTARLCLALLQGFQGPPAPSVSRMFEK